LYDIMPTILELAGVAAPPGLDGVSIAPTLTSKGVQSPREWIYWEFPGYGGQQALRFGDLKAVRVNMHKGPGEIELYDLAADPAESRNLADDRPDDVARALMIMREARTDSLEFPFPAIDRAPGN
jgi:arylsulfatase A